MLNVKIISACSTLTILFILNHPVEVNGEFEINMILHNSPMQNQNRLKFWIYPFYMNNKMMLESENSPLRFGYVNVVIELGICPNGVSVK